jgi:hypothetical protein
VLKITNLKNLAHSFLWWGLLLILSFYLNYFVLYLPNEKILFGDSKSILACSNFTNTGLPSECPDYLYGRFLREMLDQATFLHSQTNILIFGIVSISLMTIANLFANLRSIQLQILGLVLFLSPAVALLIQRANLDILIFSLCWLGVKLFFRGKMTFGLSIVLLAGFFKIYPIALFLLLVFLILLKKISVGKKIFWVILTVISIWSVFIDIRNIPWLPSDARNSFGLRIFGEYVTYAMSGSGHQMFPVIGVLLGVTVLAFLITILNLRKFSSHTPKISVSLEPTVWFLYFLAIFASGISIDYRLIFLLPSLALMLDLSKVKRIAVATLYCFSFYFSYPFEVLQVVGDVALFSLMSFNILLLWRNRQSLNRNLNFWRE